MSRPTITSQIGALAALMIGSAMPPTGEGGIVDTDGGDLVPNPANDSVAAKYRAQRAAQRASTHAKQKKDHR